MAQNSGIEWTHHTGNLWWGCTKVHEGCDNCYAEALAKRTGSDIWGNDKPRKAGKSIWNDFLKWQALAHSAGEVHRCFVGSMMDIFEKSMPLIDWKGNPAIDASDGSPIGSEALRDRFFNEIIPACPNLMFLLLTKRPSNINKMIPASWKYTPPKNVMFGTSPVNQPTFDTLVRQLLNVNGRRFLSIEPQLDFIAPRPEDLQGIDWIIQGGESGPNKRPFQLSWAMVMQEICIRERVPYFFKQIDKVRPVPENMKIRQFPQMQEVSPAKLFA